MNVENDFIPLEVVHPGAILAEELKERRIRQSDFARYLGMTTGYLRCMLKGKISFTEWTASKIESELGIPAADWMRMQVIYDNYSKYTREELVMMNIRAEYKKYDGLPIEEVVRLELEKWNYEEDDLTEDQMERFKEEMIYRMNGGLMLDGVLTEIPPYSTSRFRKMMKEKFGDTFPQDISQ